MVLKIIFANHGIGQWAEVEMNKKLIIIISASIIIIITAVSILFFVNQSNTKKPVITDNPTNNSENVVDKNLVEISKVIKPAVENYLTQDIAESSTARNIRLQPYFTSDSPVINREIEIRTTNTGTKSTAKVTAINYSDGEGDYPFLIVKTDITNYSGINKSTTSQTYWISLRQNPDGSYIAYDVGTMEQ